MNPGGRFDMPCIRHADEITYVRALCCILSRTEDDWVSMGRYKLVGRGKPYNRFNIVKDAND